MFGLRDRYRRNFNKKVTEEVISTVTLKAFDKNQKLSLYTNCNSPFGFTETDKS